jgi:hypothetical protein
MRPFGFSWLWASLLGCGLLPGVSAAERCVFPNDPSVLDLKRDFGAVGDGVADDTTALQAGIEASSNRGKGGGTKILFLPNGIYRVTSNLVVKAGVGPWVYGESRDGVVIRLADGAPTNVTAVLRTHPSDTKASSADFFMRNFRNLTIDVGKNPHADGIRWYGNNSSLLRQVRVLGTGSVGVNAGFLGQNGPNLIQDVVVEGSFDTGVRCAWSWGQTLSRVTVRHARKVGVYVKATAVGLEDLVVENTPIALHNEYPNDWKWWGGVVALVGGRFRGGNANQPAITNTSVLYARNVTATGYRQVLHSATSGGSVPGTNLAEYISHPVKKLFADSPNASFKLPILPEPDVPWETNLAHWVCANDYGATYGGNSSDDTAAIQAAIDAAAAAGKTVVYLRGIGGGDPNWYTVNGEVRVHGSVRLVIGLGFGRIIGGSNGKFIVDDTSAPVVKFMHIQAFGGTPCVLENRSSNRTLVVESCDFKILGTGGGDIFVTDCPCGIELRSPGQRLWARQLNPEGTSDTGLVQNHGGLLWALGVKHEGRGVRFLTDQGGQTEILGLFNYAPDIAKDDPRPAFDVRDADFSAAGVREISFGNTYPVKARERRGEDARFEKGGGWIGWALFRSGTNSAASAARKTATLNSTFPLKVSENRRYLVDSAGKPFFVMGDTPWFLQKLKLEDVRMLMDDRVAKGFNTIFLELLDDSRIPSRDGYGNAAFATDTDITRPVEAYWQYAEQVMDEAEKRGLFVIHSELWYGAGKGLWMHHANPDNAKVYGAFLGKRLARFKNLMWMHAGDRNPDANLAECTRVLAREIQAAAPHHLHTVHNAHEFASARFHHEDPWLDVNLGYTYGAAYLHILPEYQRMNPVRPVILGETGYEAEPNAIELLPDAKKGDLWTPYRIRRNAWWAVTSGAVGYCAGTRLWRWEPNWRETMQVRSTIEAPNLLRGMQTIAWWKLVPDAEHEFLTAGFGAWKQADYATAALADDGTCAVVYLPTPRTITVDLAKLKGPVMARWFDPTTAEFKVVEGAPFSQLSKREFTPPRANSADESDRVLFCQTESPGSASPPVNRPVDVRPAARTNAVAGPLHERLYGQWENARAVREGDLKLIRNGSAGLGRASDVFKTCAP